MKLKFTHPTIPTSEVKITKAFSQHMPRFEKLKSCVDFYRKNDYFDRQIIVDADGYLHDGYCAYLVAVLAGVAEVKVQMVAEKAVRSNPVTEPVKEPTHAESKPEPVKLYCTESFAPGEWLTKGKIYDATPDFLVTYDDGFCPRGGYDSIEEFHKGNPETGASLFPLVRRPAKVGEWVYLCNLHEGHIPVCRDGEIVKIDFFCNDNAASKRGNNWYEDEYLVLDGYHGEAEDVRAN